MSSVFSRRTFLAALGGLAAFTATTGPAAAQAIYALTGTVIPGDGSPARANHAVLVRGERIEAVLPAASLDHRIPVLHAGGHILPGVINCHVHRIHTPEERYDRFLAHGVTSIGDAASPLDALTELTRNPAGRTATAACAGPMFCPEGAIPCPCTAENTAWWFPRPSRQKKKSMSWRTSARP